ncbi:MAG: amino acid ABC transporter permease [Pseudomonadota bacterium]
MSQNAIAFVATEQIPASPPPPNAVGPVKWVKDNLFPGPVNSILTIVSIGFIAFLAFNIVPWFWDSSWFPEDMSLRGCRAEASGACFAVIVERFWQFIFGFYPSELYWRPAMAFVLLLLSVWPVLFKSAPRPLLILTMVYPAVAYWLIWGGTIWGPVFVLAGPVVGWAVFTYGGQLFDALVGDAFGPILTIVMSVLATIVWWLFFVIPLDGAFSWALNIGLEPVQSGLLGGFLLSLIIGVVGISASLPIGVALALGRQSKLFIVRTIAIGFIEFIRGVPLITLLFVASVLLNYFMPPGTNFDIILRVCIMVTLFASAYMAEVIRGGIAALPKGQYEAADAMGLTYWQAQRLIVLPQALKISIPNIVSTFIGLFKDTTLVIIIGLLDPLGLTNAIRADAAWNGIFVELYLFVALFFFIFCFGMSRYSMYLERKLATDHR